ncbi:MAG: ABC transporter, permease protein 1 (cluster 11, riboflavin/purine nucleoside/unknown), partial [uncultured Nocardioidaceae bacterium]
EPARRLAADRQGHGRCGGPRPAGRRGAHRPLDATRHRVAAVLLHLPVGLLPLRRDRGLRRLPGAARRLGRLRRRPRADPRASSTPDLRGARREPGVPQRAVQHRRPGSAHRRRDRRGLPRLLAVAAAGAAPARRGGRRDGRGSLLGRHRRLPQGPDRRARGHHHDHAQLRRALPAGLPARAGGLPASRQRQPALTAGRGERRVPGGLRGPPRGPARGRRRGRCVVAARAEHAGLRDARGGVGSRRRPDRGNERAPGVRARDGARRAARRPGRGHARAGPAERAEREPRRQRRLRRDHRGPARPGDAAGDGAGGAALRGALLRRAGDAGCGRRTPGARAGAPGAHRALRRRAGTGPRPAPGQGGGACRGPPGEGVGRM